MRQAREFAQRPDHCVKRVGDADHKGIGGVIADAFTHRFHDFEIDSKKVIAAHARFARHTSRHNANIRAGDIGVRLRTGHGGIKAFGGARLCDIQGFAFGHAFRNIEQHDVAEFFKGG
jgi:hypothetical protein